MSFRMPCRLSCKSRSVFAKPLEHQCSWATMSPVWGANSARNSPPHVPKWGEHVPKFVRHVGILAAQELRTVLDDGRVAPETPVRAVFIIGAPYGIGHTL